MGKSIFNADNNQITDFVQFLSKNSSPHGAPQAANLLTLPCKKKTKKCKNSAKTTLISPLLMLTPAFYVHISYINMFMSDITWQPSIRITINIYNSIFYKNIYSLQRINGISIKK